MLTENKNLAERKELREGKRQKDVEYTLESISLSNEFRSTERNTEKVICKRYAPYKTAKQHMVHLQKLTSPIENFLQPVDMNESFEKRCTIKQSCPQIFRLYRAARRQECKWCKLGCTGAISLRIAVNDIANTSQNYQLNLKG